MGTTTAVVVPARTNKKTETGVRPGALVPASSAQVPQNQHCKTTLPPVPSAIPAHSPAGEPAAPWQGPTTHPLLFLQQKLAIGSTTDPLEAEADRVADQVMGMSAPSPQLNVSGAEPAVRRKCACEGSGSECPECRKKKEEKLQRKAQSPVVPTEAPPIVHQVLRAPGQRLDAATRAFFEPRFGADFSHVRVHTDAQAAASAHAVNALAYTVGDRIVFGADRYSPQTTEGGRLLAHELVHVVQREGPKSEHNSRRGEFDAEGAKAPATPVSVESSRSTMKPSLWTGANVLQRVTDQPELQAGIGIGSLVGNSTVGALTTCLLRAGPAQWAAMLAYRIVRILSATGARRQELIDEMVMQALIPPGAAMTTACDCIPPRLIAWMAEWGLSGYPDASAHLQHYLTGGGAPYSEDIPRILREDAGVSRRIEAGITKTVGDLVNWVTQDSYSTKNWLYALGGVDLFHYEILQDPASKAANAAAGDGTAAVMVSIRDPYEWHPDKGRAIPCLHTGMEAMKAAGAKDFMELGTGTVRLHVSKALLPLP